MLAVHGKAADQEASTFDQGLAACLALVDRPCVRRLRPTLSAREKRVEQKEDKNGFGRRLVAGAGGALAGAAVSAAVGAVVLCQGYRRGVESNTGVFACSTYNSIRRTRAATTVAPAVRCGTKNNRVGREGHARRLAASPWQALCVACKYRAWLISARRRQGATQCLTGLRRMGE